MSIVYYVSWIFIGFMYMQHKDMSHVYYYYYYHHHHLLLCTERSFF